MCPERNIKLTMTSEDVIHDFSLPAFAPRPTYCLGATRPNGSGRHRPGLPNFLRRILRTKHSGMVGTVLCSEAAGLADWLAKGSGEGSMAEQGQALLTSGLR